MHKIRTIFLFGVLYEIVNITPLLFFAYKNVRLDIASLSTFYIIEKSAKIFFDIPFGALADKFGYKVLATVGVMSKLLFILSTVIASKPHHLYLSSLLLAVSRTAFNWKFEVFMYNAMRQYNILNQYGKVIGKFYLVTNIIAMISSLYASQFEHVIMLYGVKIVILYAVILVWSIIFLYKSDDIKTLSNNKDTIRSILSRGIRAIFASRKLLNYSILMITMNIVVWNIRDIIPILFSQKDAAKFASLNSFLDFSLVAGCAVFSLLIPHRHWDFRQLRYITLLLLSLVWFGSYIKALWVTMGFYGLFIFIYVKMEVSLAQILERDSIPSMRTTIASFSSCVTSIISVGLFSFIGFASRFISQYAVINLIFLLLTIVNVVFYLQKKDVKATLLTK